MLDLGFSRLQRSIAPAAKAALICLPAYRRDAQRIILLSGVSVGLEAAGIGLIYLLIKQLTGDTGLGPLPAAAVSPALLTLGCVLLLTLSIGLKQSILRQARAVALKAGEYAARLSLIRAHALLRVGGNGERDQSPRERKQLLALLLKSIPFVCGFTAEGFTLVGIATVQAGILLAILLWLSPLLTALLLLSVLIGFVLVSASFQTVVSIGQSRREHTRNFRREADEIGARLFDAQLGPDDFANQIETPIASGPVQHQLALRLTQRMERRGGSLVLEYLYPVAILCIVLLYLSATAFAPSLSELALYFLLIRQTLSALKSVGTTLMSFSRHQSVLLSFQTLMDGTLPQAGRSAGGLDDDDDDD
jgi:hypothetical protein